MNDPTQLITRRGFSALAGAAAAACIAGCAPAAQEPRAEAEAEPTGEDPQGAAAEPSAPDTSATDAEAATGHGAERAAGPDALIVYFSRAGENYDVGLVAEGNTEVVAHLVEEATGLPSFRIVPRDPYPESYDETLDRVQDERAAQARPVYEPDGAPDGLSDISLVYLGFPTWWGDLPEIVRTFCEAYDWTGVTIAPFNTAAGSGFGSCLDTLAQECPGAAFAEGLTMLGTVAQNDRLQAEELVGAWLA